MPLYYLNYSDGHRVLGDDKGSELADLDAARMAAVESARDMMADDVKAGLIDFGYSIQIEDENRRQLTVVSFRDAIEVRNFHPGSITE